MVLLHKPIRGWIVIPDLIVGLARNREEFVTQSKVHRQASLNAPSVLYISRHDIRVKLATIGCRLAQCIVKGWARKCQLRTVTSDRPRGWIAGCAVASELADIRRHHQAATETIGDEDVLQVLELSPHAQIVSSLGEG